MAQQLINIIYGSADNLSGISPNANRTNVTFYFLKWEVVTLVKWVAVPYVLSISTIVLKPSDIAKMLLPLSPETTKDIGLVVSGIHNAPLSIDSSLIPIGRYVRDSDEIVNEHVKLTIAELATDKPKQKIISVDMGMRNIASLPAADKITPIVYLVSILVFYNYYNTDTISIKPMMLTDKNKERIAKAIKSNMGLSPNTDIHIPTMIYHRVSIPVLYKEIVNYMNDKKIMSTNTKILIPSEFPAEKNQGPLLVPVHC